MNTKYLTNYSTFFYALFLIGILFSCNSHRDIDIKKEQPQSENTAKRSIAQTLQKQEHLPIAEQIALYRKLKKESPSAYNFENEDEMTMYGYRHLWANKTTEALEIFKL